ncbi:hypothetical protein NQ317_006818, partial [Molorchus minor]
MLLYIRVEYRIIIRACSLLSEHQPGNNARSNSGLPNGRRWTVRDKAFIYRPSPWLYIYRRVYFQLPSIRTLKCFSIKTV